MNPLKILFAAAFGLITTVALAEPTQNGNTSLERRLSAHLDFLASDRMRGRDTGSTEYEIAAQYMATQFQLLGLQPAGEDGSWFQRVPLVANTIVPGSTRLSIYAGSSEITLNYPDDYLMYGNPNSASDSVRAPVVFAGYGIVAPTLQHDDYAGLDVRGKFVVVLAGKPAAFPSEEGAHLASGGERQRYAAERGAIGIVNLQTPDWDKVVTYDKFKLRAGKPRYHRLEPDGSVADTQKAMQGEAHLSKEAGAKLFDLAGKNLQSVFEQMAAGEIPQGFDMGFEMTLERKTSEERLSHSNVVAKIEGVHPELGQETVVFSAHLDHVGVAGEHGEGGVKAGAIDNALGNAVLIEAARMFSQEPPPRRSIVFVSLAAEEQGLLGSGHFAAHPPAAAGQLVADINLDNAVLLYPFADVIAFGAEHSNMGSFVERAAGSLDLDLTPDPVPEMFLFVRSDHYSFVKQGIPSIFLWPGFNSRNPALNGKEIFQNYFGHDYHQPSDDLDLPVNFGAAAVFTRLNHQIGAELANSPQRPRWNEGDFFGDTFAK